MKLRFSLRYLTEWGESLYVVIEYLSRDGRSRSSVVRMDTNDGCLWTVETAALVSGRHPVAMFKYAYELRNSDGEVLRREWDMIPRMIPFHSAYDYVMLDSWRDIPLQQHLYTNAYLTTVHAKPGESFVPLDVPLFRKTLLFAVSAPQLSKGQAVALCGNHPALGNWNTSRYLKMQYSGQTMWVLPVNAMGIDSNLEYKFVVVDETTGDFVAWEEGNNRSLGLEQSVDGQVTVCDGGLLRVCEQMWKVAGVVVPVASLRSSRSYGIGDFGDLRLLVDWAAASGMKAIQVLPVNDTGALTGQLAACPYDIISVNALNPCYIDLESAGELSDKTAMTSFHKQRMELNAMRCCNYEATWRVKSSYLRSLYREAGELTSRSVEYQDFIAVNEHWLADYAAYCLLCRDNSTTDTCRWSRLSVYDKGEVMRFLDENSDEARYVYFVQYLLHRQLKAAADYARSQGVFLMCDIPIGVARHSVETWVHPGLFNMDEQAGTVPDAIRPNGQNWGFPTFNWDSMMADGCSWWRARLARLSAYFDAFRLDHVLGFFRIWEIPAGAVSGRLGHFSPSLPFTPDEIERFGLKFRKDLFTKPFINDRLLERLFGLHTQYVRDNYLVGRAYNIYDLRPEYDTQAKISRAFEGKDDENSIWIRDGLYRLVEDVLFVEDPKRHGNYHPRIYAYREPVFEVLNDDDREAFMRLYSNYFFQRHNLHWGWHGMNRLAAVMCGTRMLATAEDLGPQPDCVAPVLEALRILGLDVQTMPRQEGQEFAHLNGNKYRGVATFATHDMAPMRLWWEENPERTQRYYATMLQKSGMAPQKMPPYIAEEIVARHLYCPSMMCMLALQDWLAIDAGLRSGDVRAERINVPGSVFGGWDYRMHITLERMNEETKFSDKLKTMIKRSRR